MLTKSGREIFHKLLDYLGVELRLRCVSGGPPDRNSASNNGLCFYAKDTGRILSETAADFEFEDGWNAGDEQNAARFLFESCVGFIDVSHRDPNASWRVKKVIENPFFGCSSLEAAALKLDILTGGNGAVKDDGKEENLDKDRCKELVGKLCQSLGWRAEKQILACRMPCLTTQADALHMAGHGLISSSASPARLMEDAVHSPASIQSGHWCQLHRLKSLQSR